MSEHIFLTREELYDAVWAMPIARLAASFGISDVALAKTCRRMGVPRPGRGYWARVAAGHKPKRTPLPKALPKQPTRTSFQRVEPKPSGPPPAALPEVPVPTTLETAHEAVRALARALRTADVDEHERLMIRGKNEPVLRVTIGTHRRALLILDALAKALVERGHRALLRRPEADDKWQCDFVFEVAGEEIEASIIEPLGAVEHVATPDESKRASRGSPVPKYDYAPSGRLQFSFYLGSWRAKNWTESDKRPLERRLGAMVVEAEELARKRKEWQAEAQRQEVERLEAERERQESERRAKHQERLRQDLHAMVEQWESAERILAFLRAVEHAVPGNERDAKLRAWLTWAEQYARSISPTCALHSVAKSLEPSSI